jgi:8-oxo-dGTP diphosphatase
MSDQKPRIGIGVIIQNPDGKILVAKRKGSHAPYYSIPGGHLETGETFEECAIREVKEEHGITIKLPKVIAVTNNLETYRNEGLHYISIILLAGSFSGKPMINEPDKCEEILWVDPTDLPQPHFDASSLGVKCFLENKFYVDETS